MQQGGGTVGSGGPGPTGAAESALRHDGNSLPGPTRSGGQRVRAPLPIPDWPAAERPRERLLRLGPGALADGELLAILVRSGPAGQTAVDLGRRMLALGGRDGAAGLGRLHPEELLALPGMGPAKAALVLAALELGRRVARREVAVPVRYRGPEDVGRDLALEMETLDREQFRVLLLDTKHGLIGMEVVAVGGLDHVPADPREVFKPAVRRSAAAVIVAHNHPSGDPEPSAADLALTKRLVAAGLVLGVPLLDHLIIGRRRYVSLAARGVVG